MWLQAFRPACVVTLLGMPITLPGQLAFDVASIKESTSLNDGGSLRLMPDGGVRAQNVALRGLITIAYRLEGYQLVNAPGWASQTRYNIEAKPAEKAPREQIFVMLQALLVDRFRFAFHREKREVDGYSMVRTRPDRLGPDLHLSEFNCETNFAATPKCREGGITADSITTFGAPLSVLLQMVVSKVGAPVSDDTGLTGTYNIQLRWSNEVAPTDDRPSIYTALQDQLGLKLERRRVTTEVVIVDRLERATPD